MEQVLQTAVVGITVAAAGVCTLCGGVGYYHYSGFHEHKGPPGTKCVFCDKCKMCGGSGRRAQCNIKLNSMRNNNARDREQARCAAKGQDQNQEHNHQVTAAEISNGKPKYCTNCGNKLPQTPGKFCAECGTRIAPHVHVDNVNVNLQESREGIPPEAPKAARASESESECDEESESEETEHEENNVSHDGHCCLCTVL